MSVSAIIVTRGDVDLSPVLDSLPTEWQMIVYDNGKGEIRVYDKGGQRGGISWLKVGQPDLLVYGRYAAIEFAHWDVIYVQDDDVIVSDPQAIVDAYDFARNCVNCGAIGELTMLSGYWGWVCLRCKSFTEDGVVCNMPQEFRHDFYVDHALVGFGAAFHRYAPKRGFDRWYASPKTPGANGEWGLISRTCDIIFTGLTQRILVDIPKTNLPYAEDDNRMWKQPEHQGERAAMRELMLQVKREAL